MCCDDDRVSSVTTKLDVEPFPPSMAEDGIHKARHLRDWLLSKLINAELACYKSSDFLRLEERTRLNMLSDVSNTLIDESKRFLQQRKSRGSSEDDQTFNGKEKRLLSNVKSLLGKKSKSFMNSNKYSLPKSAHNIRDAKALSSSKGER